MDWDQYKWAHALLVKYLESECMTFWPTKPEYKPDFEFKFNEQTISVWVQEQIQTDTVLLFNCSDWPKNAVQIMLVGVDGQSFTATTPTKSPGRQISITMFTDNDGNNGMKEFKQALELWCVENKLLD